MRNKKFLVFIFAAIIFLPALVLAQENRSYQYDKIDVVIEVNKDSTFDVTETQTYNYVGEYHQGWRSIPLNKISAITDVVVIDGATGKPLTKSAARLDKTNQASWAKYTTYREGRNVNIEWYYDLKDTTHTWVLKYKVHGGIGFYKDHDEIYWNVFTDYSVPVISSSAKVFLPANNFVANQETSWLYWSAYSSDSSHSTNTSPMVVREPGGIYSFVVPLPFGPQGKFTIAAGWPKGLILQKSFWWDWFFLRWGLFASLLVILITFIFAGFYWYFTERFHKGRGTIIPQYEPPKNLPPAMAELIIKENISRRTFPATIIDLAVRGYVEIVEEKSYFSVVVNTIGALIFSATLIAVIWGFISEYKRTGSAGSFFLLIIATVLILLLSKTLSGGNYNYILKKKREYADDHDLHDFEREFLAALLRGKGEFSTAQNRFDQEGSRALYEKMKKVQEHLLSETDLDSQDFENGLKNKKYWGYCRTGLTVFSIAFIYISAALDLDYIFYWLGFVALVCLAGLFAWIRFNPRLSENGHLDRENWLGFKMYLEKAEKYRLQNLTPDLFEKYLPYAMIFGIEKKWAKNFDSLNIQPPSWYVSSSSSTGFSSGATGGFSASAFSSSFSSSFSSAFSSSGGSGGAGGGGGGGGSGGGGGGGGGGAS